MCKNKTTEVYVKVHPDISYTSKERWDWLLIDSCIASLVKALQENGLDMKTSCCGHGKINGNIVLVDGRILVIYNTKSQKDIDNVFINRVCKPIE